jgi:hypothetical protein
VAKPVSGMRFDFEGMVVLVTGAGRGLGFGVALLQHS